MIPRPIVEFTPPTRPLFLTVRNHNALVRNAVRVALANHWSKHTRRHFQKGAAQRYAYFPRSAKYRRRKLRVKGHDIDMLWTGQTRAVMTAALPKIVIGGAAEGGKKGITGRYALRFPFAGGTGRSRQGQSNATRARMVKEMERWAGDEANAAVAEVRQSYREQLNSIKFKRQRRRGG